MSSDILSARSRVAVAVRQRDAEAERDARRDLAAAKLEAYAARVVAEAPPLTEAQRDRITALLAPSRIGGGAR